MSDIGRSRSCSWPGFASWSTAAMTRPASRPSPMARSPRCAPWATSRRSSARWPRRRSAPARGRRDGERLRAPGGPAFLAHPRDIQVIDKDELVVLRPGGVTVMTPAGEELDRAVTTVDWDEETAEKGGFETFMLKEMHEQGEAV